MRYPQLLIWEGDGRLASTFRQLATDQCWTLREPRRVESVLRLLSRGGPSVVVVRTGSDLERELALVERVRRSCPEADIVVIVEENHSRLVGLVWDLGATYVLFPSQVSQRLIEVVTRLLESGDG